MGLRDEISDLLDELLAKKKQLPHLQSSPQNKPTGTTHQPDLRAGARDVFAHEAPDFGKPTLLSPAMRLSKLPDSSTLGSPYISLPPHIHPSPSAKPWYERRASSVDAGASSYILDYASDPESTVYWIAVGTDQHLNSFYEFWVDGAIFEPITGAAQVGTILNPFRFSAAIPIKTLRLRAYNFNPTPFTYEVVVAGWIDKKG